MADQFDYVIVGAGSAGEGGPAPHPLPAGGCLHQGPHCGFLGAPIGSIVNYLEFQSKH